MLAYPLQKTFIFVYCLTFGFLFNQSALADTPNKPKEIAIIETSLGVIKVELFRNMAPLTVDNFIQYVKSGYYNETLFHRVIPDFMIQAGGFDLKLAKKTAKSPIKNEANAFVPNRRGTISMARTSDPNSATSQFFINVKNNFSLNKKKNSAGYAVFGKVIEGMEVADKISLEKTITISGMADVPKNDVIIKTIKITTSKHKNKPSKT